MPEYSEKVIMNKKQILRLSLSLIYYENGLSLIIAQIFI